MSPEQGAFEFTLKRQAIIFRWAENYRNFLDVTTSSKRLAVADVAGEYSDVTGRLLS